MPLYLCSFLIPTTGFYLSALHCSVVCSSASSGNNPTVQCGVSKWEQGDYMCAVGIIPTTHPHPVCPSEAS